MVSIDRCKILCKTGQFSYDWWTVLQKIKHDDVYVACNLQHVQNKIFDTEYDTYRVIFQNDEHVIVGKQHLNSHMFNKLMNAPAVTYPLFSSRNNVTQSMFVETTVPKLMYKADVEIKLESFILDEYTKYKYETFDEGWGCGWRCMQTVLSKLKQIDVQLNQLKTILERVGYEFDNNHYGYFDGKMIAPIVEEYGLTVGELSLNHENFLNDLMTYFNSLNYDNTMIVMIHDGYIVTIDDFFGKYMKVVDPHQSPSIPEFISLEEVGKGGIGWKSFEETVFLNMKQLWVDITKTEYLQLNPPSFFIVKSK